MEEAVSAEARRKAARLAMAEVWREGVVVAANEDSVWPGLLCWQAGQHCGQLDCL